MSSDQSDDAVAQAGSGDWAIELAGASKVYKVYEHPFDRVRELFGGGARHREFVALQPIDLRIRRGAALGLVGDNGAGKSTLMHLLAGSHQPSTGRVTVSGKVLGLLELGVGFHPEFSGRENVFFYADMLGLERAFVEARFDQIADFAELGSFIEQPLRTYSTGMRVRLAFSLVASLDPDILIIDEALSVGDMHFQKKCIDRMMEFRRAGKTIILCSHSLYQISTFCDEVAWLKGGAVNMQGTPVEVLPAYEAYQMARGRVDEQVHSGGTGEVRVAAFRLISPAPMNTGDDLVIEWSVEAPEMVPYHLTISLKMDSGRGIFVTGSQLRGDEPFWGVQSGRLVFPRVALMGGEYLLHLRVWDDAGLVMWDEAVITELNVRKQGRELGVVRLPHEWLPEPK